MQDNEIETTDTGDELSETLTDSSETEFVAEEPKQSNRGTLMMGVLVAAAVGGMYLMHLRTGPATAIAAPESVAAANTINSFLSDTGQNAIAMKRMLKETEKEVQQFSTEHTVTQIPLEDLKTNPFRFASDKGDESAEQSKAKREEEHATARADAQKLQVDLQSIITGEHNTCLIHNTMYTQGQTVDGFVIAEIDSSKLIVRRGEYAFSVPMRTK
jgi:membrane-associated HD superfamily phosphohydrolase